MYAIVHSNEKLEYARKFGVNHTINYEDEDFADAIYKPTYERGGDMVVDHIGAEAW